VDPNRSSRRDRVPPPVLEKVHEFAIAPRDLSDSLLARCLLGSPSNQRIPESGPADGKANETRHTRGDLEPFLHFSIVLAAAKDDAADLVAATGARRCHNRMAILPAIKTFDLP